LRHESSPSVGYHYWSAFAVKASLSVMSWDRAIDSRRPGRKIPLALLLTKRRRIGRKA
jgi:hypothetical protein